MSVRVWLGQVASENKIALCWEEADDPDAQKNAMIMSWEQAVAISAMLIRTAGRMATSKTAFQDACEEYGIPAGLVECAKAGVS